jgi:integrase
MLKRRGKSGVYHTRFTAPDGSRISRSTETTDRKQAQEFERKLKAEIWRVQKLGAIPRHSWQEAVLRFFKECEQKNLRKTSVDRYMAALKWVDAHLVRVGLSPRSYLDEFTTEKLADLRSIRMETTKSVFTTNRTLSFVRALLRAAASKEWRWLATAPEIKMPKEPKTRTTHLTPSQAASLIRELPVHLVRMMRLSVATGLRDQNVTRLRWSWVDLDHRMIVLSGEVMKNREPFGVSLNEEAVSVLRECQGEHSEFVFCYAYRRKDGRRLNPRPVLRPNNTAWKAALKRAGIQGFRWHDLRHTWASWHAMSGTSTQALMELGSWSTLDQVKRYAHLSPGHLVTSANAIGPQLRLVVDNTGANLAQADEAPAKIAASS